MTYLYVLVLCREEIVLYYIITRISLACNKTADFYLFYVFQFVLLDFHVCLFALAGTSTYHQGHSTMILSDMTSFRHRTGGVLSSRISFPFNKLNLPPGHHLIPIPGNKKKECKYCQRHKFKTKSGYSRQTQYKCETCDVALCSGGYTDRNCLVAFHNEMYAPNRTTNIK